MQSNNGWSIIVYSNKEIAHSKIRRFIKDITKNGLKNITPKCQLFLKKNCNMREGLYLFRIGESAKPLRSRLEAIPEIETPTTI